jgi:hypothetical protein
MSARFIRQAERLASGGQGWQIGARRDSRPVARIDCRSQGAAWQGVMYHGAGDRGALGKFRIRIRQDIGQLEPVPLQIGGDIGWEAQSAISACGARCDRLHGMGWDGIKAGQKSAKSINDRLAFAVDKGGTACSYR